MGFSQEGRSYWLLKMAPVSAGQLLIAKFLVAFLPAILLSSAFLLALTLVQGAGVTPLFFTLPILALVTAGMTGVNLAFGVAGANMDWEDPRKMQKGTSGCLGSLVTFLYLPFSLGLFFGPSILAAYLHWPDWTGRLAGLLLGGIFSLVCTVIPPLLARPRVLRLSEA
jgi:hypothetical protein